MNALRESKFADRNGLRFKYFNNAHPLVLTFFNLCLSFSLFIRPFKIQACFRGYVRLRDFKVALDKEFDLSIVKLASYVSSLSTSFSTADVSRPLLSTIRARLIRCMREFSFLEHYGDPHNVSSGTFSSKPDNTDHTDTVSTHVQSVFTASHVSVVPLQSGPSLTPVTAVPDHYWIIRTDSRRLALARLLLVNIKSEGIWNRDLLVFMNTLEYIRVRVLIVFYLRPLCMFAWAAD